MGKVDVKDVDHLRAMVANYERRGMSKAAKYSKAHLEDNLKGIIRDHPEKGGDITTFIKSLGFTDDTIIDKVVDDYMGPAKAERPWRRRAKMVSRGLPESLANTWPRDESESVYASEDEPLDLIISYHNCPECKAVLKISANDKGSIMRIEAAPKIAK